MHPGGQLRASTRAASSRRMHGEHAHRCRFRAAVLMPGVASARVARRGARPGRPAFRRIAVRGFWQPSTGDQAKSVGMPPSPSAFRTGDIAQPGAGGLRCAGTGFCSGMVGQQRAGGVLCPAGSQPGLEGPRRGDDEVGVLAAARDVLALGAADENRGPGLLARRLRGQLAADLPPGRGALVAAALAHRGLPAGTVPAECVVQADDSCPSDSAEADQGDVGLAQDRSRGRSGGEAGGVRGGLADGVQLPGRGETAHLPALGAYPLLGRLRGPDLVLPAAGPNLPLTVVVHRDLLARCDRSRTARLARLRELQHEHGQPRRSRTCCWLRSAGCVAGMWTRWPSRVDCRRRGLHLRPGGVRPAHVAMGD